MKWTLILGFILVSVGLSGYEYSRRVPSLNTSMVLEDSIYRLDGSMTITFLDKNGKRLYLILRKVDSKLELHYAHFPGFRPLVHHAKKGSEVERRVIDNLNDWSLVQSTSSFEKLYLESGGETKFEGGKRVADAYYFYQMLKSRSRN
ncbi:hypothetical protein [Motilimonas sp. E26]|uniref:hypothetical protein n=1 Tax=Motilimonas sp. E26 TaxID=2865674 RepID=UPI001E3DBCBB|nr:hypothetical protein [Motilimonas sp. E26]MCE0558987.1 hypothetical protein [Motilimonas sp. E26]